ncbi:proline-specific peptidase [Cryphonectria parasitica EP155]|uniref:Proline-specific peptidase n=1 Tax=Cryphonectria parasitica (strain ATCC 38755 / EP155) TaxID=660469 RepID=A0A9P5CQX2_CRYP1|nr:proline-specific peptidase [Cryphonectria parasitica EP155]KAF3767959.1 proline-specific peptidase [Cryphonectria parasitica EP155]
MAQLPTKEGSLPFEVPGRKDISCSTYYKIVGDLSSGAPPLVVAHGGPGAGHDYLLSWADLWPQYGLPVVFYDQIGCGSSTHLPDTLGDTSLWQESTFVAELNNLIDHLNLRDGPGFHLLGQSWGGMFGVTFASGRPRGLQKLVLANALASKELSSQGYQLRIQEMPPDKREVLEDCLKKEDFESPAYQGAMMAFYKLYLCRDDPFPPSLLPSFKNIGEAKAVNQTMNGRSVLIGDGSMKDWTSIPGLPQVTAPTLVYNGEFDSSHDVAQVPFFELIPRVRWITFAGGSHMCHLESGGLKEKVFKTVGDFLTQGQDRQGKPAVQG